MFVDSGTLHDLEIIPTPMTRGLTLWSLLDRTRSRAGREALRHALLSPVHSAEDILALQAAHQALGGSGAAFRTILDGAGMDGVENYLDINWQLPADMGGLLWRHRWYPEYLQDVADGQMRIRALLTAASDLGQRLSATDAALLRTLAEQIKALLAKAEVLELVRLAASQNAAAAKRDFDQLARDLAKPALTALLACMGRVEGMWSLADATLEQCWSYPRPASRLAATGLFHPFLGPQAIRNDLDLEPAVRVCFVTGPNMAGKSTFLKAAAVAVFLAHIGCGVPAASMDFPVVGAIFSSVQIVDDLGAGESFYLAEVRRLRALAVTLSEHRSIFAVVDEPFRGTNVHDAAEATVATITRLADHPAALVVVASHVAEVVPAVSEDPRVRLLHFAAEIRADQPHFDYRIRPGVSVQRLGMTLLRREGVLELLESSSKTAFQN
jgi:DNA mismatch repair protein MutS